MFCVAIDHMDTKPYLEDGGQIFSDLAYADDTAFYRAMHFSAKRGIAIVYCPSVRLSVCV